jgi:hypothetical protein
LNHQTRQHVLISPLFSASSDAIMVDSAAQPMRTPQNLEPADEESDSLILFLIADFLARSSSCQRAAQVLTEELVSAHDSFDR